MKLAALLAVLLLAALDARAFDVATLFARLAGERPPKALFHETKHLALLDRPLESSGELTFTPPDRLEKRTLAPRPERLVVEGENVVIERAGKTHGLNLRAHPAVAVLVESIRATLAGDLAGLSRTYAVALEGDEKSWRLRLRPLDPSLATLVERVEIGGSAGTVRTVEIFQADGDRSVMRISPAPR